MAEADVWSSKLPPIQPSSDAQLPSEYLTQSAQARLNAPCDEEIIPSHRRKPRPSLSCKPAHLCTGGPPRSTPEPGKYSQSCCYLESERCLTRLRRLPQMDPYALGPLQSWLFGDAAIQQVYTCRAPAQLGLPSRSSCWGYPPQGTGDAGWHSATALHPAWRSPKADRSKPTATSPSRWRSFPEALSMRM